MALFNRFEETIFLKEDSDIESQISKLEQLKDTISDPKLDYDLKCLQAGLYGEKALEYELKNNNIGMYVLHDVNLVYEDLKAQIDYVVYTSAHCYFIECKNMYGNISVDRNGQFVREFTYNGRKIKEAIYSPYTQAQRHKEIFIKLWSSKRNTVTRTLARGIVESYYKPVVVFANPKGILNIKYAPKDIKENIIRLDQLNEYLKNDIKNCKDKDSKKTMEDAAHIMLERHVPIERDVTSKYLTEKVNDTEAIRDKLILFRKEKAKEYDYPAYCVFTNKQLDQLLEYKPDSIEALIKSGILPEKRVQSFGEGIIACFK